MRLRIAALLVSAALLAPLAAQHLDLDRDRGFVRALVRQLGFVSLAQSEVEAMKLRTADADELRAVAELDGEIALLGAKLQPDAQEQRRLYDAAVRACAQFLARYGGDDRSVPVRLRLSEAALELGRLLAADLERARTEAPDTVADLESRTAEVFASGVAACAAIRQQLAADRDDVAARADCGVAWMRMGVTLREHALAVPRDRAELLSRARSTLEDLIFTWGEHTLLGQRALFEYEQISEVAGELADAVQGYRDTIAHVAAALDHPQSPLRDEVVTVLTRTLAEAYARLGATLLRLGRNGEVAATVQDYRAFLRARRVPLTDLEHPSAGGGEDRTGHALYLSAACAMAAGGKTSDVEQAMRLLRWIADRQPGDELALRAVAAMREIAAAHAGAMSGETLLDVAMIDYRAHSWDAASRGIATAIAAMSAGELERLGLEAHAALSQSLAMQGRDLEAGRALVAALARCTADADAATRERVVSSAQRTAQRLRGADTSDAEGLAVAAQLADLLGRLGADGDAGKRRYDEAGQLLAQQRYDEALVAYRDVGRDSPYHELARAGMVIACQRKGDFAAARAEIDEYRAFLASEGAALPDARPDLLRARRIAQARVDFYAGYLSFLEGIGRERGHKDPTRFPAVIAALGDFADRHGDAAPELVPLACFAVGRSQAEIGDLAAAEARYRTLASSWPHDPNIPALAAAIFAVRDTLATAKTVEALAIARSGDAEQIARSRDELAALRHEAVAIGLEYVDRAHAPQLGIVRSLLLHLEALADWTRVESLADRMLAAFGEDPSRAREIDALVRPSLGRALLEQHRFAEAYDVLAAAERADPDSDALKRLSCLCLGGWQELDARGEVHDYLGLGRPAEAYRKYSTEYRSHRPTPAPPAAERTLAWYRYCFELYRFAAAAGVTDNDLRDTAKTIYAAARSDDGFTHLTSLGETGKQLCVLFTHNAPLP